MSNRKFVVPRTTPTGKSVIYFAATVAVAVGALSPIPAQAQSASEVYRRMSEVYTFAKSYQGTIVRVENGKMSDGKSASQSVTIKISFKAPNKYLVNTLKSMTTGGKTQSFDQTMVTDGKSLFMFSPVTKLYQLGQIQNENQLSRFFALLTPVDGFSLLPESTVKGRTVFVLTPNIPLKDTPAERANAKKVKITLMVDKQNYQFLKMTIESATGQLTQSVSDQRLNAPVPDSLFVWTPPASYKKIKAQIAPTRGPKVPR